MSTQLDLSLLDVQEESSSRGNYVFPDNSVDGNNVLAFPGVEGPSSVFPDSPEEGPLGSSNGRDGDEGVWKTAMMKGKREEGNGLQEY